MGKGDDRASFKAGPLVPVHSVAVMWSWLPVHAGLNRPGIHMYWLCCGNCWLAEENVSSAVKKRVSTALSFGNGWFVVCKAQDKRQSICKENKIPLTPHGRKRIFSGLYRTHPAVG
jgi:hypothetical protein